MNKRLLLMLIGVAILFGAIFGFKWFSDRMMNQFFDDMPQPPAAITVATARIERWAPTTESPGTLSAVNGAELSTELGGIVHEIHFDSGQRVVEGDRLISLDTRADRADLESLVAARNLAEQELQRQRRLVEQQSGSRADLDRRQSEFDQARARVAAQQARIDQKTLRAPFDGIAGIRRVNPGQYVAPGTPLVALQSVDPIYADFELPERELARLREGIDVSVRVDAWPGEDFAGTLTAIEPAVQASTRTVAVQATLDNPDEKLRPGMFARVELNLDEAVEQVVIPQTAIRYSPYGNSVFIVEGSGDDARVRQHFVTTGATRGDLVAVSEGLDAGQTVASSGLLKLQNDTPVNIVTSEALQPSEDPDPQPDNS